MIDEGGNDTAFSMSEEQPTVESEVSLGSPEQRLANSQVVSVEEVRQITDIHVQQTTVDAERSRSADPGDSDILLREFLGQSTNVLDECEIQTLIEGARVGFQAMLEGGVSTVGVEETFGQATERVAYLRDAAQLEGTAQTSTLLKKGHASHR